MANLILNYNNILNYNGYQPYNILKFQRNHCNSQLHPALVFRPACSFATIHLRIVRLRAGVRSGAVGNGHGSSCGGGVQAASRHLHGPAALAHGEGQAHHGRPPPLSERELKS